jgi:hypothetical protein
MNKHCPCDPELSAVGVHDGIACPIGRASNPLPPSVRECEGGCGCRYGTQDPDRRDCGCGGPCAMAEDWGCRPDLGGCGGDCPSCAANPLPEGQR